MKDFIRNNASIIAAVGAFAGGGFLILGGGWLVLPFLMLVFHIYTASTLFFKPVAEADLVYWYPPQEMIDEILREMVPILEERGYGRMNYVRHENDCDDGTYGGRAIFHELMMKKTKEIPEARKRGHPLYSFSFRRRNGARHRLFFVVNDRRERTYVENYPVFDQYHDATGMKRGLNEPEEQNGAVMS